MTTAFLLYVHGRTVPIPFQETLTQGFGKSLAVGILILGALFPLKWLFPAGVLGAVAIVSTAVFALFAAGLIFIVGVNERTALRSMVRRFGF
jgi:hypothetical protein